LVDDFGKSFAGRVLVWFKALFVFFNPAIGDKPRNLVSQHALGGGRGEAPDNKTISIDATYLKAHRTEWCVRLK
jgi:hypothetical protein